MKGASGQAEAEDYHRVDASRGKVISMGLPGRWMGVASVLVVGAMVGCGSSGGAGDRALEVVRDAARADCKAGDARACDRMCGALGPKASCEMACAADQPASCMELGVDAGFGFPRPGDGTRDGAWTAANPVRARELLGRACALGYATACLEAGEPLLATTGFEPTAADEPEGKRLLASGCALEHDHATAVDSRWRSCLALARFTNDKGGILEAAPLHERGCALSPSGCRLYVVRNPFDAPPRDPAEDARIVADREAAVVRGMNLDYAAGIRAVDWNQHDSMLALVSVDHGPLARALPRLLADAPVGRAVLLQYDRVVRMARTPGVSNAELSKAVDAYTDTRLALHMELGRRFGLETTSWGDGG